MKHRERLALALRGEPVDRPPLSLWRHFGGIDMTEDGLVDVMLDFQRQYDFDFLKFMPTGMYSTLDWGVETTWEPHARGTRTVTRHVIGKPSDWEALPLLDIDKGQLGMVNRALARTVAGTDPDTPVLQTIFSPLTTANKMAGQVLLPHLRQHPDRLRAGLATIAEVTERMIAAAIDRGAGIFYASQMATADVLTEAEVAEWETPHVERLLGPLKGAATVFIHAHGNHLWFDSVAAWPADGLNWHDRRGGPSLAEARRRAGGGLLGGIDGYGHLRDGSLSELFAEIADATRQVDRGLVVTPGCVIPMDCPPHLIRAAREAIEALKKVRA
jgi:uroporphyrinogen decarboxylase